MIEPYFLRLLRELTGSRIGRTTSVLAPEIAQTLVTIGVDLTKMHTVGDLQGGIEEAERLLGYRVVPLGEPSPPA